LSPASKQASKQACHPQASPAASPAWDGTNKGQSTKVDWPEWVLPNLDPELQRDGVVHLFEAVSDLNLLVSVHLLGVAVDVAAFCLDVEVGLVLKPSCYAYYGCSVRHVMSSLWLMTQQHANRPLRGVTYYC